MRIDQAVIGILLSTLALPAWADEGGRSPSPLVWQTLPSPPEEIALNGAFCGVVGDALVLAGGSAELFGGGAPSPDAFSDRVFVLSDPGGRWRQAGVRLPRPTAFGISLNRGDTLVCLGGSHGDEHTASVFELRQVDGRIERSDLPPLPCPAAYLCGAAWGDTIYVAGGQTHPDGAEAMKTFRALDLAAPKRRWKQHEPWPGPARMLAVAAVQGDAFYLFGGCDLNGNGETSRRKYLADAYAFSPEKGWRRVADLPMPWAAAPSPAVAVGQSHVFLLGGATRREAGPDSDEESRYRPDLLAYHTITDTWVTLGQLPLGIEPGSRGSQRYGAIPIAPTGRWREHVVLPVPRPLAASGGGRILWAEPQQVRTGLGLLDYVVLAVYLASLVGMGLFFARREKNTEDFFLAGRRVPWWAAGISLFGTKLSSLTFMAIPAMVYQTDWTYFLGLLMMIAGKHSLIPFP